jgi:hypothetical protein
MNDFMLLGTTMLFYKIGSLKEFVGEGG